MVVCQPQHSILQSLSPDQMQQWGGRLPFFLAEDCSSSDLCSTGKRSRQCFVGSCVGEHAGTKTAQDSRMRTAMWSLGTHVEAQAGAVFGLDAHKLDTGRLQRACEIQFSLTNCSLQNCHALDCLIIIIMIHALSISRLTRMSCNLGVRTV